MLSKLEKYSKYIQLPRSQKLQIIKQARPSTEYTAPIPRGNASFAEENFAYLTVFDSNKPEKMYKLKTYREGADIQSPKAVVALFHGLTSHVNRGAHLAKYLATKNIITVGYDFRGYGKSEGLKGYIQNFDHLVSDSEKFMKVTKDIYPTLPVYGVGLSLGGAVAYHLSLKHRQMFNGTVLMAPALKPAMQLQGSIGFLHYLAWLAQFILPSELRTIKMKYWQNCKNPNYREYCQSDALHQKERIRLRTLIELIQTMRYGADKFSQYDLPFMIVQGGADKLISPQVAFELFQKSKTALEDKEILFYEHMLHDVWAESEIHQIQEKVAEWILNQAQKSNRR